ncbi:MAG: serine protease AprX [Bacteroidia bacterium]|jgi:serine protease AprX
MRSQHYRIHLKFNMLRFILLIIYLGGTWSIAFAQTYNYHFFVAFTDKNFSYVDFTKPELYLTQAAIDRRARFNIDLDTHDYPVTKAYVDNIKGEGFFVRYETKWMNGLVVTTETMNEAWRLKIKFYVRDVVYLGRTRKIDDRQQPGPTQASGSKGEPESSEGTIEFSDHENAQILYGQGYEQLHMMEAYGLHEAGYRGKGINIAILDAGFKKVDQLSAFEELRKDGRIKMTYDVVDLEEGVYEDNDHGTNVLGVLASNKVGDMIGSAPDANYFLFRTEAKQYESWLEEFNWIRAAEMADSLGVDVINSSLGYNAMDEHRLSHRQHELNGRTAYISLGAEIAVSRGIVVVNASGNDGNKTWGKINFPADVDEVLVVGAVNSRLQAASFSSHGPTSDGRNKPDVSALGVSTAVTATYGTSRGNGTSFACPVIAGLVACLLQADSTLRPADVRLVLMRSSHLYPKYDSIIGYGVPNIPLAQTIMGKDVNFNYRAPHMLLEPKDTIVNGTNFTAFHPQSGDLYLRIKEQKRFLLFNYLKTREVVLLERDYDGFGAQVIELKEVNAKHQYQGELLFHPFNDAGQTTKIHEVFWLDTFYLKN